MRILMWILRLALFFILFGFAVKNDQLVNLYFFFDAEWQLPLVFVILIAFAAGAVLGVTVTLASLLGRRRQVGQLRRELERERKSRRAAEASAVTTTKTA